MIGEYRYADRFEDVSRVGQEAAATEARQLAARAEAIDADALDEQRRITRAMVAWDASARAGMLDSRTAEFGADPIFGVQSSLAVTCPSWRSRRRTSPRRWWPSSRRRRLLRRRSPTGTARASRPARTPADFAVGQTVAQLDRWLATPVGQDPMLR